MLNEFLSSLEQAVFGMTILQRYNAPKISLAASFSFLKTNRLVQALFSPAVVLKPCFLFPAFSPCRQTKKEGLARPFVHTTVHPPRSLPTSTLGKEREGIGDGKGNPISRRVPFPIPKHGFQSIPRHGGGKRSQLLAHIQLHELGDGVIALERAGVRAVVEHGTESLFVQRVGVLLGEMGAKAGKLRAQLRVVHRFERGILGGVSGPP